jgi:hypothetical protein
LEDVNKTKPGQRKRDSAPGRTQNNWDSDRVNTATPRFMAAHSHLLLDHVNRGVDALDLTFDNTRDESDTAEGKVHHAGNL